MKTINIYCLVAALVCSACEGDNDAEQMPPPAANRITFTDPGNSGGCVDFQVYHYSDDQQYGLLLSGNTDSLNLSASWQTFEIEAGSSELTLTLYEFSQPVNSFFCDDVVEAKEDPIQEWPAVEGSVRLRIAQERNDVGVYTVDVVMIGVVVNGTTIDRLERNGVAVGFHPG